MSELPEFIYIDNFLIKNVSNPIIISLVLYKLDKPVLRGHHWDKEKGVFIDKNVNSLKRFNSYEIAYMTGQENGDIIIQMTAK